MALNDAKGLKKLILKSKVLSKIARTIVSRYRDLLKKIRTTYPNPIFWARLTFHPVPSSYIVGEKQGLYRPEAIVFSPDGNHIALSNSARHSISFYSKDDSTTFKKEPCGTISDPQKLYYVHDSSFSPDNKTLAIAAREDQSISTYAILKKSDGKMECFWIHTTKGQENGLGSPAGISYHPSGKWVAVANRKKTGISVYRISQDGTIEDSPAQIISQNDLDRQGLTAPHGLDFSPDGEYLAVVHKRFGSSIAFQDSSFSVFRWNSNSLEDKALVIVPYGGVKVHLVAFHPSSRIVGLANEDDGVDLLKWIPEENKTEKVRTIRLLKIGGAKGIAFAPLTEQVAVTTDLNEVLFFNMN